MKIIMLFLNVIAIFAYVLNILVSDFSKFCFFDSPDGAFWYLLLSAIIIINIIYILRVKNFGWLSLYFKRKALEEKKKIQNLKKDLTH